MWYHSGIGPNYVNCNAAFSDRSTKGLQGSHYTLRFYCKPGNKEPVSCCSKTTPLPSMFKKHFVPVLCCPLRSLSEIKWMFDSLANWRARTIKIVLWYCKLCICSCFDSVWCSADSYDTWYLRYFQIHWDSLRVYSCADGDGCLMIKNVCS